MIQLKRNYFFSGPVAALKHLEEERRNCKETLIFMGLRPK